MFYNILKCINTQKFYRILIIAALSATCNHTENALPEGKLIIVCDLPAVLSENSGMIEYNGLFWFINDGGNEPVIYGYNTQSGEIERQLSIQNTENIDWEEITQDELHFYLGDFGNNSGDRKNLRIIIIDKKDVLESDNINPSGVINFGYSDQHDFTPAAQNNSFDCEAFLVFEDSILLFTKDWVGQQTSVYSLPAKEGNYQAILKQTFDSAGLITASVYLKPERELVLLGYSNFIPFIWIISNFDNLNMSFASKVRIDFPESFGVQTEAFVISNNGTTYIASEAAAFPARLYKVDY